MVAVEARGGGMQPTRKTAQRAMSARKLVLLVLVAFTAAAIGHVRRVTASDPPGLPATEQVKVLDVPPILGFGRHLAAHPTNPQVLYWSIQNLGVLKSIDGGLTWAPRNHGLPSLATTALTIDPADPNHMMVGFEGQFAAQGAWPYRSVNGGDRWEPTVVCERDDGLQNLRHR